MSIIPTIQARNRCDNTSSRLCTQGHPSRRCTSMQGMDDRLGQWRRLTDAAPVAVTGMRPLASFRQSWVRFEFRQMLDSVDETGAIPRSTLTRVACATPVGQVILAGPVPQTRLLQTKHAHTPKHPHAPASVSTPHTRGAQRELSARTTYSSCASSRVMRLKARTGRRSGWHNSEEFTVGAGLETSKGCHALWESAARLASSFLLSLASVGSIDQTIVRLDIVH